MQGPEILRYAQDDIGFLAIGELRASELRVHLGNWQLDTVDGGDLSLDGGVLFGIVPRLLWQQAMRPDAMHRVRCRSSCLLARDGRHTVLIDTGYGGKGSRLERKFHAMEEGEPLLRSLAALGVEPDEIDTVVLSHLHFDHVGGATRYDAQGRIVLTFPRARHIVGRMEWEDALSQAPELARAYPMENLTTLRDEAKVVLVEGNTPIMPGLRTRLTGGHTRGHLAVLVESGGQTACCLGDFCPTTHHLRRSWCLAYDTHLLDTRRNKPELLAEAAAGGWWLLWPHDPKVAAGRLEAHPKRQFVVVDPQTRL